MQVFKYFVIRYSQHEASNYSDSYQGTAQRLPQSNKVISHSTKLQTPNTQLFRAE